MNRRAPPIVLCLVLQAHAAWGQQTVTSYRRPPARALAPIAAPGAHAVDDAEYALAHPPPANPSQRAAPRPLAGAIGGLAFAGLGAALTRWLTRDGAPTAPAPAARPRRSSRAPGPGQHPGVEVRRVSVAFDQTARAFIQHALAPTSAESTPAALHAAAQGARDALAQAHRAARHGVFQTWALDPTRGPQVFGQVAASIRARSGGEALAQARRAAAGKPDQGPGLVVVTLLVAANGPLAPLPSAMTLPALMAALAGIIPPRPEQLAAFEVVWSPAEEGDPLPAAALAALHPELLPLVVGAGPGRRACESCRAVCAGEFGRCPACGAV